MFKIRMLFVLAMSALIALPHPASAQSANGARMVDVIDLAEKTMALGGEVCTSTYISNATLLDDCIIYENDIARVVGQWETYFLGNVLTVAYDAEVQAELQSYESSLQTVLQDAGYTYNLAPPADVAGPLKLAPDDLDSPDVTYECAVCGIWGVQAVRTCLASLTASPAVSLVCFTIAAVTFLGCVYIVCPSPKSPPKCCTT